MKKPNSGGFWRLEEERPWLTRASVKFIERNIDRTHNVLEFGSGASTIFFARRAKHVISFESGGYSVRIKNLDRSFNWYKGLVKKFKRFNINNVELYLLHSHPQSSIVYEHVIDSLSDNYFHWVLVDGANRKLCIEKSMDKIVNGGHLIVDNYDHIPPERFVSDMDLFMKNEYCADLIDEILKGWKRLNFDEDGYPGKGTVVFKKP